MDIKNMHEMIEKLVCCAKSELDMKGIEEVDAEEMGKVVDIIKDLAEARYYQTLTKAMEDSEYGEEYDENGPKEAERKGYRGQPRDSMGRYRSRRGRRGYEDRMPMYDDAEWMRDMDRNAMGRMYYTDTGGGNVSGGMASSRGQAGGMNNSGNGNMGYSEGMRDSREGRSGQRRKSYMESKEMHRGNSAEDKQHKMKELENYMNELGSDITEMIADSTPEEKSMLKTKLQTLATKIS